MAEETKPITEAAAAGAVPTDLEKFKGTDGKLDTAKLSQGYLEAQKMAHEATVKRGETERAYAVLVEQFGGAAAAGAASGADGRGSAGADDTTAFEEEQPLTRKDAQHVVQGLIELVHPEVALDPATNAPKDKVFFDGLITYVKTLPTPVKKAILAGDYSAQDWAIKQYKAIRGAAKPTASTADSLPTGDKPNFIEGASPSVGGSKKTWTAEEIKTLMRQNPGEYAKIADTEIAQAYAEGRVK